jgi:hypothetical protein
VAAQALHDLEALADRGPEVAGALDQVALVQVVRPDPVLDEAMDERSLDVDAVVDAGQQDALVAERDPGPGQLVGRPGDLGRDLVGVVEVEVHPDRVVRREHLAQLVVDPLGHEHRDARSDPDDLDVGDLAEAPDDPLEQLRSERQAVAAGDQDVTDLGCAAEVLELGLVLARVEVLGRVADDPAAGAVAAVARTLGRHEHQDPVGVAMDEPGHGRVAILGEAVLHHRREGLGLAAERDDLAPDRVARVVGVDEAGEVGRDVDPELVLGREAGALVVGQVEDRPDLVDGVDPVAELPAPVVPLCVGHVGPQRGAAAAGRLAIGPERLRRVARVDPRLLGDGGRRLLVVQGRLRARGIRSRRVSA